MIDQAPVRRRLPAVLNVAPAAAPAADEAMPAAVAPASFAPAGLVAVTLPDRIPAGCVYEAANDYRLNPLIFLAILKVESNGRPGAIGRNTNGSIDIGPGQFNSRSWAPLFVNRFNIPAERLLNDMCQAVRAMAYALRTEINNVRGDVWLGVGNYHVGFPGTAARERAVAAERQKYIGLVHGAHVKMITTGKF